MLSLPPKSAQRSEQRLGGTPGEPGDIRGASSRLPPNSSMAGNGLPPSDGWVRGVFGNRGSGKSYFAREYAKQFAGRGKVVIYSTPNGEGTDPFWARTFSSTAFVNPSPGFRVPTAFAIRGEGGEVALEIARNLSSKFKVTLILDEAHETFPEGFSASEMAGEVFHRSRHMGLNLLFVSQWPARLDKRVFRASDTIFWFKLVYSRDLEWVAREYGDRAALQIQNLKPRWRLEVKQGELPAGWGWKGKTAP